MSAEINAFAYDGNENVRDLTDGAGAVVDSYEYDPFGRLPDASGTFADENSWQFSTKIHETDWGLYYYGRRYYSPGLGRWLSRDPSDQNHLNVCGFILNSPNNFIDVLGLYPVSATIGSGSATYTLGAVTTDLKLLECGGAAWAINFRVTPDTSGIVFQYIEDYWVVYDCDTGDLLTPDSPYQFWESFVVPWEFYDIWAQSGMENTYGEIAAFGYAFFTPDITAGMQSNPVSRMWRLGWYCCCDSRDRSTHILGIDYPNAPLAPGGIPEPPF